MFARIGIPTIERKEVLTVPEAAIQRVDGRPLLFVRLDDTKFERRFVETGLTAGGLIEIRSGLKAGEQVVGAGSFYLKTALLRERVGDAH
jgi:cobalt-zinc-cadmium efflux system membrane fusion protein